MHIGENGDKIQSNPEKAGFRDRTTKIEKRNRNKMQL